MLSISKIFNLPEQCALHKKKNNVSRNDEKMSEFLELQVEIKLEYKTPYPPELPYDLFHKRLIPNQ